VAPQVPAYTIAAPGQILLGLMLLALILPALLRVWLDEAGSALGHMPGLG
jgi:flagellar biosynthesis protein FliR